MHSPDFPVLLIRVDETDSTINYLQRLSTEKPPEEFTTVVAGFQTSGKGQRGNSWESLPNKNLLFSFVVYPGFLEIRKQFLISKIVAIAIKEALDAYGSGFSIKWPNDIYWHDKKICGTLIENDLQGNNISKSVAGIGINVNQETFYSSAPNPVSLFHITGKECELLPLLCSVVEKARLYYQVLQGGSENEINDLYHRSLYRKNGFHLYADDRGTFSARIIEVLPTGTLVVEDETGRQRDYLFKEVRYIVSENGN